MMPGNRKLVRRLRAAAKREVKARKGARWPRPTVDRALALLLRLLVPIVLIAVGSEFAGDLRTLLILWSIGLLFLIAFEMRNRLSDPLLLAMICHLPFGLRGLHRAAVGKMWRKARFIAYDWLCLFVAVIHFGKSWGGSAVVAAIVGALVMGVAMLALAACLVVLLPRRIGWGMFATAVWGAAFFGMILRERIPPEMWQTGAAFLEKTPFYLISEFTIFAIGGNVRSWIFVVSSGLVAVLVLRVLWRMSEKRFDPYVLDQDDSLVNPATPEGDDGPSTASTDLLRTALAAELAQPPGMQTASRGFIEKRMISMLNPETRRTLDLLAPSGMSWGVAWWAAVAWIFGGTLLVMGASSEVGYYLMIIGFITAIPAFGGNWRLMQEQGTGWLALQQWVILPLLVKDVGRAMLLAGHLRLLLALPLIIVSTVLFFPNDPQHRMFIGLTLLALAALPIGVSFKWIAGVAIMGSKGQTSLKRIFTALGVVPLVIGMGVAVFVAPLPIAIFVGCFLIAVCHFTRIVITRRIDRGRYDFV